MRAEAAWDRSRAGAGRCVQGDVGRGDAPRSEAERRVYGTKSEAAREGMRMLLNEGVTMRSMRGGDWAYLVTLCDPEVQDLYARRCTPGSPFSRVHMGLRQQMDVYLANYIASDWLRDVDEHGGGSSKQNRVEQDEGRQREIVDVAGRFRPLEDRSYHSAGAGKETDSNELLGGRLAKGPDGTRGFSLLWRPKAMANLRRARLGRRGHIHDAGRPYHRCPRADNGGQRDGGLLSEGLGYAFSL